MSKQSGLFTDLYSLTMMQGLYLNDYNPIVIFDMFFRHTSQHTGYAIFAGLQPLLEQLLTIEFNEDDIDYLRNQKIFKEEFLNYLKNFHFNGDVWSFQEGSVCFPLEPLIKFKAPIIECILIEGLVLNTINFQSLIATKSARICHSAKEKPVVELGLRRAQGPNGALYASRSAYIGGTQATSFLEASKLYDIPPVGTMSHAWVMCYQNELKSFEDFAKIYPNNITLLLDTHNTLSSGLPNAITLGKQLQSQGINIAVRLDSGDLEYLSQKVRTALDKEGLSHAKIIATNDLDEFIISQLMSINAPIDIFGVGTRIITGGDMSALPGVFKLVELQDKNSKEKIPLIKTSNNIEKSSLPSSKQVLRFFHDNKYYADLIILDTETLSTSPSITLHHPFQEHINRKIPSHLKYKPLLQQYISSGSLVGTLPTLKEVQTYAKSELSYLDKTYLRLLNPHMYTVSISDKLKQIRDELLYQHN